MSQSPNNKLGGFYTFYPGWNTLAINEDIFIKSLNEIKGDCEITNARIWDALSQDWDEVNANVKFNSIFTDSIIGRGISIKVSRDCIFFKDNLNNVLSSNESIETSGYYGVKNKKEKETISSEDLSSNEEEKLGLEGEKNQGILENDKFLKYSIYFFIIAFILIILGILIKLIINKREKFLTAEKR